MTNNILFQRDIISTRHMDLAAVELVLTTAEKFKKIQSPLPTTQTQEEFALASGTPQEKSALATSMPVNKDVDAGRAEIADLLGRKIIANCFFEPSTRTRLSFEAAALRLGAKCIGFSSDDNISVKKGETLADTMRMVSTYADLIVIRHPLEGAAALAAEAADCPVINAGDGANQHPTQALLDLFSIRESQDRINGLSIALVGDLKYGRTIHSFTSLCSLYDVRLYLVSPEHLALPEAICDELKKTGIRFSFHQSLEEIINKVDILYMTRIQQERFITGKFPIMKNPFSLNTNMLAAAKPNLKVLHPLPRVNEIEHSVDRSPYAYYFQQARNGLYVRQALLSLLLNEALP